MSTTTPPVRIAPLRLTGRLSCLRPSCLRLAWLEARPAVQVIFQLRFLTGAALAAAGGYLLSWPAVAGALCWFCVVAAIYTHNGAADVTEDRGNGSGRPVASGRLPAPAAAAVARGLGLAGVAAGLAAPAPVGVLALVMLGLGWAYSSGPRPMKNTVAGFALVVVSGGLLTYLAGAVVGGGRVTTELVCCGLVMSVWMGIGGSTKDLSDVRGDRQAGRRTLPVLLGPGRCRLVMALGVLAVGSGSAAICLAWLPRLRPMGAVLLVGAVLVVVLLARVRPDSDRARRRRPYRAFMITQYGAHVVILAQTAFQAI